MISQKNVINIQEGYYLLDEARSSFREKVCRTVFQKYLLTSGNVPSSYDRHWEMWLEKIQIFHITKYINIYVFSSNWKLLTFYLINGSLINL